MTAHPVGGSVLRRRSPGNIITTSGMTALTKRRVVVGVASAALVFLSVAGFSSVYGSARRTTPVVVAVRTITAGQPFTVGDLAIANVSVPAGVSVVPASSLSALAGRTAATAVAAGSIVNPAAVALHRGLATGSAVVGIALKDGAYPPSGLHPGDHVMVVDSGLSASSIAGAVASPSVTGTSPTSDAPAAASGVFGAAVATLVPSAPVYSVQVPQVSAGSASLLVGVTVPISIAAQVTAAATAGQISLALVPAVQGSDS